MSKIQVAFNDCLASYVSVYNLKTIKQSRLNAIINRLNTIEDYIGLSYSIYLANHYKVTHEWNDLCNFIVALAYRIMRVYKVEIFVRNGTCFKKTHSNKIQSNQIFNSMFKISSLSKVLFNFANESDTCKKNYEIVDAQEDNMTIYRFVISVLSLSKTVVNYEHAIRIIKKYFANK